jgi:hypothetical protein
VIFSFSEKKVYGTVFNENEKVKFQTLKKLPTGISASGTHNNPDYPVLYSENIKL